MNQFPQTHGTSLNRGSTVASTRELANWNCLCSTYLRSLRSFLNLKSFYSIKGLEKLQKSFHVIFLWRHGSLFLFRRSCTRFTLRKWQQKKASLPVIQRLRREKRKLQVAPNLVSSCLSIVGYLCYEALLCGSSNILRQLLNWKRLRTVLDQWGVHCSLSAAKVVRNS